MEFVVSGGIFRLLVLCESPVLVERDILRAIAATGVAIGGPLCLRRIVPHIGQCLIAGILCNFVQSGIVVDFIQDSRIIYDVLVHLCPARLALLRSRLFWRGQ